MEKVDMKLKNVFSTSALLLAAVSCAAPDPGLEQSRSINAWLVNSAGNASIENSIIAQHTLFPYHFFQDSPALNDLGDSDLAVLAAHYRMDPGSLNLRQADAPDALYKARKQFVLDRLAAGGVDIKQMAIEDRLAGGDGADSERVVRALSKEAEKQSTSSSATERQGASAAGGQSATGTGMKGTRK
jgi:hypothetical protein